LYQTLTHVADGGKTTCDSKAVIKVVRYGLNLACFPDAHAVELVERQIAKQREPRILEEPDVQSFDAESIE
jgi:hypothetical protein